MGDVLNSAFDAWNERLRSPFWGAIILAFLAFNWQPIWYLLFADVSVEAKFEYWEERAIFWEPLSAGVFFALVAPLIKVIMTAWYKWPTRELRKWKDEEATKRKTKKVELEIHLKEAEIILEGKIRVLSDAQLKTKISTESEVLKSLNIDLLGVKVLQELRNTKFGDGKNDSELSKSPNLFSVAFSLDNNASQEEIDKKIAKGLKQLAGQNYIEAMPKYFDNRDGTVDEYEEYNITYLGNSILEKYEHVLGIKSKSEEP